MASTYVAYSPAPLISGEVSSTTDVTLSTTTTVLPGITTTLPIGSYLIWFSGSLTSDGTNAISTLGLYVGGVLKADSVRIIQPYDGGALSAASSNGDISINARITLTVASVVQVQASCPGTAIVHERTMDWLKVG